MNKFKLIAVFTLLTAIVGCASNPQLPVAINSKKPNPVKSVVVAASPTPKSVLSYPGASCLLCLGAAAAGNQNLSAHSKTLPTDDLTALPAEVLEALKSKGIEAQDISSSFTLKNYPKFSAKDVLNASKKDFSSLKDQYGASHLLFINFTYAGMTRNYSSYVPTSAPFANVSGLVYMVDLETNTYVWYQPVTQHIFADGEWKQPKDFPNLTNAFFEAIEGARDAILNSVDKL